MKQGFNSCRVRQFIASRLARIQHILNKNSITLRRVCHHYVSNRTDKLSVLYDGAATHECGQEGTTQINGKFIKSMPRRVASAYIFMLPSFIFVRCILYTVDLQFSDHTVKLVFPKLLEPISISKPFYKCRANCIICTNEQSAVPSRSKRIITISTESPYLWAIVRTVNAGSNIAATRRRGGLGVIT